ncbi:MULTISPECIES: outer membrane protein assembly factor BamE [Gammaproteobacteria]|uniref:outer membrane protein assembly factor BamE n=1 Tax=Gammaproteobacteria TaxID=1236 RepID=UPI000DD01582|nr:MULTISPECIES: outer membrane protein assembly factor BamE [Gammaproteobacteria]RTE86902.1 outer membrane protein assembly factor BamE [Aliidiomarina sp. B3213]TCZ93308.1 outer membrane protein assembly factor BamE [Lysobacter sp. N42]
MKFLGIAVFVMFLAGCSVFDPLVYKIDIPQGNYLEQRDVDNLRVGMTHEQVTYVLGSPVAEDAFRNDTWHYIYRLKPGRGDIVTRELFVHFENGRVVSISGDFETPEDFNVPLDA